MFKSIRISILIILPLLISCSSPTNSGTDIDLGDEELTIPDWTTESHSNEADPDYEVVFDDASVKELYIEISETNWNAMQADLDQNLSSTMPGAEVDFDPVWVPATLTFEGKDWYKVGIRYKGNSTLRNAYNSSTDKYPFKLAFSTT